MTMCGRVASPSPVSFATNARAHSRNARAVSAPGARCVMPAARRLATSAAASCRLHALASATPCLWRALTVSRTTVARARASGRRAGRRPAAAASTRAISAAAAGCAGQPRVRRAVEVSRTPWRSAPGSCAQPATAAQPWRTTSARIAAIHVVPDLGSASSATSTASSRAPVRSSIASAAHAAVLFARPSPQGHGASGKAACARATATRHPKMSTARRTTTSMPRRLGSRRSSARSARRAPAPLTRIN